jgi:hypothetical protein
MIIAVHTPQRGGLMATTAKPFRVKCAPPGMTWTEAKAAGALRESETGHVFDRYSIVSEQDKRDVATRNAGRLQVAVAVGESKSTTTSTTGRKSTLRLPKGGS